MENYPPIAQVMEALLHPHAEVGALVGHVTHLVESSSGGRSIYASERFGLDTVVTHTRMGEVAYEYGIPLLAIRTISDVADENAHTGIRRFVGSAADHHAGGIIKALYALLKEQSYVLDAA